MAFSTFNSVQSFLAYVRARVTSLVTPYNFPALDPSLVLYYPLDSSANVGGGFKTANFASQLPVYDASMAGSSMITYALNNSVTSFGDLSLNNTMGAQLVANNANSNYVVSNTTFAPNISGGFSVSLWFSCSGQLNKRGTLISLPLNTIGNGIQIDVSGTNMIYTGWNLDLPAVSTSLSAYFPLSNTTKESVSGLSVTDATTVTYSTISGRTGIVCDGTTYASGATNFIQDFNIPSMTLTSSSGISISLWYYPTTINNNMILLDIANNTVANQGIFFGTNILFSNSSGFKTFTSGIVVNTWYHFVVTITGTTVVIYLNNTVIASTNYSFAALNSIPSANNRISIGRATSQANAANFTNASGYPTFSGTISKVAIYNMVLSAAQVSTLYTAG